MCGKKTNKMLTVLVRTSGTELHRESGRPPAENRMECVSREASAGAIGAPL